MSHTSVLIREARRRAGLSQAVLGARLGRPQSVIARWETGGATPSLETLRRVIRACGFELELQLVATDDSNRALIAESLRLTPAERFAAAASWGDFVEGARARVAAGRG